MMQEKPTSRLTLKERLFRLSVRLHFPRTLLMISSKKPWQLKNGCSVQRKVQGALSQQPGETATIACKEKETLVTHSEFQSGAAGRDSCQTSDNNRTDFSTLLSTRCLRADVSYFLCSDVCTQARAHTQNFKPPPSTSSFIPHFSKLNDLLA